MMPVFYHKSTIMLVDDDEMFTRALSSMFRQQFVIKVFNEPAKCEIAMKDYVANSLRHQLLKADTTHDQYDAATYVPVSFDIKDLELLNADPHRSEEISVLVVDYDMPEMNGIELCKRLGSQPFKKILLTGSTNIADAIYALNQGYIDCYLAKGSETIINDIREYVDLFVRKYYADLTLPLLSHLEADKLLPQTDDYFKNYLNAHLKKSQVLEYSLIDKNGSVHIINEDNSESYIIVHTDKSLDDFVELNDDVNEAAEYIADVKARKRIPFFGVNRECWQLPVTEWDKCFFAPTVVQGRETYYTSILPQKS